MNRALITGHKGFIGGRLFDRLPVKKQGIDRNDVFDGDFDTVFHLAARVGMGESQYRPVYYCMDNVVYTASLLEALVGRGVEHIVLASSVSAMWGGSPYAATKACQEELVSSWCDVNGATCSILRLFNVYGPGQSLTNPYTGVAAIFAQRLLNGLPPLVFEDGAQTRDFVHVDDVVAAFMLAGAQRFHGVAEIGSGVGTTVLELATALQRELGGPAPIVTGERRKGDFRHAVADIGEAKRRLGWKPRRVFADGVKDLAKSLRGQTPVATIDAVAELRAAGGLVEA